jgi:hypothetical protein
MRVRSALEKTRSGLLRLIPQFASNTPTLLELSQLPGRNEENVMAVSAEPFIDPAIPLDAHSRPVIPSWRPSAGPQSKKIYSDLLRHVLRPSFYDNLRLENSFGLQHRMLLVHVWLVKIRLEIGLMDGQRDSFTSGDALHLKNEIVHMLWTHHRRICRVADVPSGQIIKYRKLLHVESMEFFLDLDDAFAEAVKQEKLKHQLGIKCPFFPVLFKHVFLNTEAAKPFALLFQKYVIEEFDRLERIPLEEVLKGNIEWKTVPKMLENQHYK